MRPEVARSEIEQALNLEERRLTPEEEGQHYRRLQGPDGGERGGPSQQSGNGPPGVDLRGRDYSLVL